MAYQYRGTIHDLDTPFEPEPSADKCGTYAGYRQHQRRDEPACEDCRAAQARYSRDYQRERFGILPDQRLTPRRTNAAHTGCGTMAGYTAHRRAKTTICDPCRQAAAAYRKDRRRQRGEQVKMLLSLDAACPNCGHHLAETA